MKQFLSMLLVSMTMLFGVSTVNAADTGMLLGAGATFPYLLYQKMFAEYNKATAIKVDYQSIGSGGGIKQMISKTVDFGGSDAPMNDEQKKQAGAEVIHVPSCLGAICLTYNLSGVTAKLKMTPDVLADIFLHKITKWNDKKLRAINPGIKLPNTAIIVVHRSDGSGTTYNYTAYLTAVSKEWATKVNFGTSVNWPTGVGGKGNEGVSGYVKQVPGSIGYVEVGYALQNKLPVMFLQNKSGNFIDPTDLATVQAAADVNIPANTQVSIVNTDAKNGYPISTFTWLLLYKDQSYTKNKAKSKAVVDLIWWVIHDGQQYNEALNYAKLPAVVVKAGEDELKTVLFDGAPLMK